MIESEFLEARNKIALLKSEIKRIIVGCDEVIDQIIIALLAGGHILLEGVPGIGKTLLVKTLSQAVGIRFARIQFTPDLMPADITGTNIIIEDTDGKKSFQFQKGPVFNNIVLADEINRATAKTQSALLEAMQEFTVTASGTKYPLEKPFIVIATQNPIEMEGTYPLPEAQLDRFFFKTLMHMPSLLDLHEIINRTTSDKILNASCIINRDEILNYQSLVKQIPVASNLIEYTNKLVLATHPDSEYSPDAVRRYLRYGASPRASQSLILGAKGSALLNGRLNVSQTDIVKLLLPVIRHRIIMNIEGEANNISVNDIIKEITEKIDVIDPETKRILALSK
ncbi:MAG: AAA family ATPase [Planctomycetota bacterium]|nr:AAA family ATPase [Planctomycetota bacterium]MDI6786749.1 AAA family ATPase [Planctomycetota bacterium]